MAWISLSRGRGVRAVMGGQSWSARTHILRPHADQNYAEWRFEPSGPLELSVEYGLEYGYLPRKFWEGLAGKYPIPARWIRFGNPESETGHSRFILQQLWQLVPWWTRRCDSFGNLCRSEPEIQNMLRNTLMKTPVWISVETAFTLDKSWPERSGKQNFRRKRFTESALQSMLDRVPTAQQ